MSTTVLDWSVERRLPYMKGRAMLVVDIHWFQMLALINPYILALLLAAVVVGLLVAVGMAVIAAVRALRRLTSWLKYQRSRAPYPFTPATSSLSTADRRQAQVDAQPKAKHAQPETEAERPEAEDESSLPTRRRFLTALGIAMSGIGAAIIGVPVLGALFSPLLREDGEVWRPVGPISDFPIGATVQVAILDSAPVPWAGLAAQTPAWLRRESERDFKVFSAFCTHVGCPVRWQADAELFMCPCHGGVFYRDGTVAGGPPPEPLALFPVRVRNGMVEIRTKAVPLPKQES